MRSKRISVICLLILGFVSSNAVYAQEYVRTSISFADQSHLPNSYNFLPKPPTTEDVAFLTDSVRYVEGKALRSTPRGMLAREDANTSIDYILKRFSPAMGCELNTKNAPLLAALLQGTIDDLYNTITLAKKNFARQRPCFHFHEELDSTTQAKLSEFKSYPSGHSLYGWTTALVLTTICPENADEFIKTGYDYGESRVILGCHYASDVQASRIAIGAGYAAIVSSSKYQKAIKKVRKEIERLKK